MNTKKKVIEMFPQNERAERIKRKVAVIKDIVIERTLAQIEDPRTLGLAGSAGLWQGLKYRGSLKLGLKAGLATAGVMVGLNVINGLIEDKDKIKNA